VTDPLPGVDEQQLLTISGNPNGGTYLLGFRGVMCNPPLKYNVNDQAMTAALTALPTVGAGNLSVVKNTSGAGLFDVFFIGALGEQDVPLLDVDDSGLNRGSVVASVVTEGSVPTLPTPPPGYSKLGDMMAARQPADADAHDALQSAQLDAIAAKRAAMMAVPATKRVL
jgi:hypothetical protein